MKDKPDIFSSVVFFIAIVLLIVGIILSFQEKSTNIPTYSAAVLCLIFSQIKRFDYFEGLGVKAKLKDLEESVETIISSSGVDDEEQNSSSITIESLARELGLRHSTESSLDTIIRKLKDSKYSFRTNSGLARGTSLSTHTVEQIIIQLYEKGYVNKAYSKSKGILWTLSDKGKAIVLIDYED